MTKALISGERIIAFGAEIIEGENNVRVVKSNGEICGASLTDYKIVDTELPEDSNPREYVYKDGEIKLNSNQ